MPVVSSHRCYFCKTSLIGMVVHTLPEALLHRGAGWWRRPLAIVLKVSMLLCATAACEGRAPFPLFFCANQAQSQHNLHS